MNEITPEMLNRALTYLNSLGTPIKKIKVKPEFFDYLKKMCPPIYLEDLSKPKVLERNSPEYLLWLMTKLKTNTTNLYIKGE